MACSSGSQSSSSSQSPEVTERGKDTRVLVEIFKQVFHKYLNSYMFKWDDV